MTDLTKFDLIFLSFIRKLPYTFRDLSKADINRLRLILGQISSEERDMIMEQREKRRDYDCHPRRSKHQPEVMTTILIKN